MLFKDINGQQAAAQQLRDAIDHDRMPHALLISGREGSGALTLALTAAQYILCEHHTLDGEPCQRCPHCLQVQKLQHPDLHFAFPVVNRKGQSGDDSAVSLDYIAEWRDILLHRPDLTYTDWVKFISDEGKNAQIFKAEASSIIRILSSKPFESDKRVMIIWLPEKINETASNKLLKIIEEPYPKTFFLLVSNDPDRVLGTILSRCQRLNIPPLDPCWLQPRIEPDERQYFFDKFCAMMRLSYMRRIFDMRDWSVEMASLGRQRQQDFLQYAQSMIRENFILNVPFPDDAGIHYMDDQETQFSSRFHLYVNHLNVEGIMDELAQAEKDIAQNGSAKIIFFDLSLKLIMLLKQGS